MNQQNLADTVLESTLVRRTSSALCLVWLIFIFTATVYGRQLSRHIPYDEVMCATVLIILLFLLCLGTYIYFKRPEWISGLKFSLIPITLLAILALLIDNFLISISIERIHIFKFAGLSIWSFFSQNRGSIWQRALISLTFSASMGMTEEALQFFVPNRFYDLRDLLLNCLGALYGVCISLGLVFSLRKMPT